ncbi:DUF4166 domain-containing protein [Rhodobacteraceae bacterium B1Z28]|uniref:DUF4166 domain-containing protein n=1 Tax=Ruegeria haliotis TaxID=2747601 RepID=A0ABX2PNF9_9RHOB|nr:DUF4166 domain-containing protein [Ruegeria haliotis]NVO54782.1 DUF4166 domain-containing protein [Ruegeria haliotis]
MPDPFRQALPPQAKLPSAVQALHSTEGCYAGRCRIERGNGRLVAAALYMGGFPPSGQDVPVRVRIARDGQRWFWERDFDGHKTLSCMTYDPHTGSVREQFGMMKVWLRPVLAQDGMRVEIRRLTVFGIPLPAFLLPCSSTAEWQDERGQFRFDVSASAPGLGHLIRYRGWLTPVHAQSDKA